MCVGASFVLTFVLAIVGLIIMPLVRRLRKVKAEYRKTGKKVSVFTAGKVTGTYISGIIGMLVIMFIMEVSLPLIFLVVFIILPLFALKIPGVTVILCVYRQYCLPLLYVLWLWGLPKWKE